MGTKYWKYLGEYSDTADTWSALAGGGGSSPYSPELDGRLKGLRTVVGRDAATSLIDHVEFRLSCGSFTPNTIEIGAQGSGLQTAPSLQSGEASKLDWEVDQPIKAGTPIKLEGRNIGADTQVTPSVHIYGLFEAS